MDNQGAANCRWAVPTLFLTGVEWADASARPWTCMRDESPHVLDTTDGCRTCVRWEARPETPVSFGEPCNHLRSEPFFLDILS
ncbi:MAG: hypothetical protein QM736_29680 [Vicinamibacterales bacterium]